MFAVIQLGAEAGVSSAQAEKIKTVLKIMPFAILPLIASLPKYSVEDPSVRQALNIPEKVKHDPSDLPKSEGFFKGLNQVGKMQKCNMKWTRESSLKSRPSVKLDRSGSPDVCSRPNKAPAYCS
ncbi:putative mitochondrial inner membrane protein OXA1L [Apostichopus japonicus]|uniref:Putative mitochondrial inner membrane protein OXA1L n=1 Tax=Stichopus japonicus TaxID=307972 RepID=A0A2G8JFF1_STIJA|nr:putative mitochondrial inner membrane protein OXA1L [Apostichopus japonicus]